VSLDTRTSITPAANGTAARSSSPSSASASSSSASFEALGVPAALARVLADKGITTPTPIQAATLPDSLAGRDVLGRGRTGSGKTYAFVLPVLARLSAAGNTRRRQPKRPRALILAPTRELATQIDEALRSRPSRVASTSSSPARADSRTSSARVTSTSTPSRSPCSTRPTTWLTSASCPS
jgi:superfamily II DNA/RNA helicase